MSIPLCYRSPLLYLKHCTLNFSFEEILDDILVTHIYLGYLISDAQLHTIRYTLYRKVLVSNTKICYRRMCCSGYTGPSCTQGICYIYRMLF